MGKLDEEDKLRDAERDRKDAEHDREDKKQDEEDKLRGAQRDLEESLIGMKDMDAASPTPMSLWSLVLAADNGATEKKDTNNWMNDLTVEQRAKLKTELARLDKKSKKEQEIAWQDGPGASEIMRQEYVRKVAYV